MTETLAGRDRNTAVQDSAVGDPAAEAELEDYRRELTGYCYRMLGSGGEAEDAVQEVMVRAWRHRDRFEGRSSLRTWLYRIATNVCLDMLGGSQRRAQPMDMNAPSTTAQARLGPALPESAWLTPVPDGRALPTADDPADVAGQRDSLRLAMIAALQHLPPRQRAVLILREVLAWRAHEVATLLETSVASVNSALQRARARIAECAPEHTQPRLPMDAQQRELLDRYVTAFERYDLTALTSLLHEEARLSMPPYALWLQGRDEVRAWMAGPGHGCEGSRLIAIEANGAPGFAQYRPASDGGGGHEPWALQVLDIVDGRILGIHSFLDTAALFPMFGLPPRLAP